MVPDMYGKQKIHMIESLKLDGLLSMVCNYNEVSSLLWSKAKKGR